VRVNTVILVESGIVRDKGLFCVRGDMRNILKTNGVCRKGTRYRVFIRECVF
jgi:hypothetical protein